MRPNIKIEIDGRYRDEKFAFTLNDFDFMGRGSLEHGMFGLYYKEIMNLACYVFVSKFDGQEQLSYRISLVNGFPNVGPVYFKRLTVFNNSQRVLHYTGRHVIPTRLAFSRRFCADPAIKNYEFLRPTLPTRPVWLEQKCNTGLGEYTKKTFGIYETWGHEDGGMPGGHRIAPYYSQWWKCPPGLKLAEKWLDGTTDRSRIACIDRNTGLPMTVPHEYSLTRTSSAELPQFAIPGNGWCSYENKWFALHYQGGIGTHDGQHNSRTYAEAITLKDIDPWANFWLNMAYNDVKMSWTMEKNIEPYSYNWHPWGHTLWKKLETTPKGQGSEWAGREFYHAVNLAHLLNKDINMWTNIIQDYANRNGFLQVVPPESSALPEARSNPPGMTGNITQSFEAMLMINLCRKLGLNDIANKCANFIGPRPKWYTDVNTGEQANKADMGPNDFTPDYTAFTHNDLSEYVAVSNWSVEKNVIAAAKSRSLQENPFDCILPEVAENILQSEQ